MTTGEMTTGEMLDRVEAIVRAIGCAGHSGSTVLHVDAGTQETADRHARRYLVVLAIRDDDGTRYPNTTIEAPILVRGGEGGARRPTWRQVAEALHAVAIAKARRLAGELTAAAGPVGRDGSA